MSLAKVAKATFLNKDRSENDLLSIQWSAKGTHKGEFKGKKPTGKPVAYSGITVYRIKNSQIVEYWAYLDMQHLFSQIE